MPSRLEEGFKEHFEWLEISFQRCFRNFHKKLLPRLAEKIHVYKTEVDV